VWRRTGVEANQPRSDRRLRQTEGLHREPVLDPVHGIFGRGGDLGTSRRGRPPGHVEAGSHAAGVYSASRMINPLLDVWGLAAAVDQAVARPIERLLTALVVRSVVTSAELRTAIDEVETVISRLAVV